MIWNKTEYCILFSSLSCSCVLKSRHWAGTAWGSSHPYFLPLSCSSSSTPRFIVLLTSSGVLRTQKNQELPRWEPRAILLIIMKNFNRRSSHVMVTMAQSAAKWRNTHCHVDFHAFTHILTSTQLQLQLSKVSSF